MLEIIQYNKQEITEAVENLGGSLNNWLTWIYFYI